MIDTLREQLRLYAELDPAQAGLAAEFLALLDEGRHAFVRDRQAGHFTGSAWLVSEEGRRVLLMHHAKLARWLQPGGHADGDIDLARVALKEAEEETGLRGLQVETRIFDLDRHRIPERGEVPGHWHYDVRYVVHAYDDRFVANEESLALEWRGIDALVEDTTLDESLRRMARKWLAER